MARQHVHNRRAGRGSGGSSWISYSDIMAALVMVFVLFLVYSLYHYGEAIRIQTNQLEEQQNELNQKIIIIQGQEEALRSREDENDSLRLALNDREEALSAQTIILIGKQEELDDAKVTLAQRETDITALQQELEPLKEQLDALKLQLAAQKVELDNKEAKINAQAAALAHQADEINTMVGVRSEIVQELSGAMRSSNLNVAVDASGNIILETSVLFQTNSSKIAPEGEAMLRQFLPVYLDVLMQRQYANYLGAIIIEGHTDSDGTYIHNMELSLNRAREVAGYCLGIVNSRYRTQLEKLLTVQGRSESELIYDAYGQEDKEASRRVVFKFSMKDEEMVNQLNQILQQTYGDGAYQIDLQ